MAAKSKHQGRSMWGRVPTGEGAARGLQGGGAPEKAPAHATRGWRAWGQRYNGRGTWARLRLNQGEGPTPMGTPRGSPSNGAGKNDPASPPETGSADALQRKRQESCPFRRRKGRGNSKNSKKPVKADIQGTASLNSEVMESFSLNPGRCCLSTFFAGSSHLGSGARLDGCSRAHVRKCRARGDGADQPFRFAP